MDSTIKSTINRVLWMIVLALIFHIGLSYNLWLPIDRTYPLIGLIDGLSFGAILTYLFTLSFIVGLFLITLVEKWRFWGFLFIFPPVFLLIIEDITRFQVWMYIYLTLLGIIAWSYWRGNSQKTLITLQLALALVYFWTGLQKLNFHFLNDVFTWLVGIFEWSKPLKSYLKLGYAIGTYECLVGVGLLIPKTRKLAIVGALMLHLGILVFLLGDGIWNPIVYPWNIAMIGLLFVLFWNNKTNIFDKNNLPHWGISILFGIVPLFDFAEIGVHEFSFGMYSGVEARGYIYLDDDAIDNCIPQKFWARMGDYGKTQSYVSLDTWANKDLNAPSIGGQFVLFKIAKELCPCIKAGGYKGGLEMNVPYRLTGTDSTFHISCEQILAE